MKKTLLTYLVIPGILLGIFIFFYLGAVKEMNAKDLAQKQAKALADKEEADRKKVIEDKATQDAIQRQKDREAADAAKEAKKEADYQAVMTQLRNEANDYSSQADKLNKEVQDLEIAISQTRSTKEKLNRETFDLAKQVELAKIARRTAEIEIQRMVERTGMKVADTSVAKLPPPPALPAN